MDTDQLKTFLEISRTRHFGRAAQNLYLSQSTVSSRIKALEDQLGTPLFLRNRNDIQLTPAGNRLLNHAENILTAWGRAKHDVSIDDELTTSLALAATPSLWDIALPAWLQKMHNLQSDVAIHGEVLETDAIRRRLIEGTLDLGFSFEMLQLPQIVARQFTTVSLILVSSHDNQSTDEALSSNYILVDWGLAFSVSHTRHFPHMKTPAIRLPLGHIAKTYLRNCGGSAYLAESTVADELDQGLLFKVQGAPVIERPAFVLYSATSELPIAIHSALDQLV